MHIALTKKFRLTTTAWSGGTTTQLFIYPPEARYDQRNFLFRISTAEVKVEQSVFTSLPGFTRKLMILNGNLLIKHKGHYERKLEKFEQDEFDGGWETSAIGKVTDFNLMLAPGKAGKIEALLLKKGEEKEIDLQNASYAGFYFYKGEAVVINGEEIIEIEQGDYLNVENVFETAEIIVKAKADCEIAAATVYNPSSSFK